MKMAEEQCASARGLPDPLETGSWLRNACKHAVLVPADSRLHPHCQCNRVHSLHRHHPVWLLAGLQCSLHFFVHPWNGC